MATAKAVLLALLVLAGRPATALRTEDGGRNEEILSVAGVFYKNTCHQPSGVSVDPKKAALLQGASVPGAGVKDIDKFQPFQTILKDGFTEITCVKDHMFYFGDKFGNNKHDYRGGGVSEVSIVDYDHFMHNRNDVDKVPMTQKRCFEFCRTVPNMGFFGLVHGRSCYCTPYFKPMESDPTQCDMLCEGDPSVFCGGETKSSIFSMHMCASTQADLDEVVERTLTVESALGKKHGELLRTGPVIQDMAEDYQKKFGAVGDRGATELMQDAKVFAGELQKMIKAGKQLGDKLADLAKSGKSLSAGDDFTAPAVVTKAERLMEDMEIVMSNSEALMDEQQKLIDLSMMKSHAGSDATNEVSDDALKQYYPMMYFVDKKYVDVPATCAGAVAQKPVLTSPAGCATACDNAIHECVAFQYFSGGSVGGLCFLFSKLYTATYYTGCKLKPSPKATCLAKLSKFEGQSLKVDKSGKTNSGLKKLTKADRCY